MLKPRRLLLLIACLFTLIVLPLGGQPRRLTPLGSSGKRVALVIGNDAYRFVPALRNGGQDAHAMKLALESCGFEVVFLTDGTRESMDEGVNRFIQSIRPGDAALFYYSGHAVQMGGENYLTPVDLQAANEVQARNRSVKASEVVEQMESRGADLQIVVLDACRNNPFGRERSIGTGGGLAPMNAGKGTFLAYATAPGRTADDNSGSANGLYTTYLLQALREPGLRLMDVFSRAGELVEWNSGGNQVPWISSSVRGEFYFRGSPTEPAPVGRLDAAAEAWMLIKDSRNPADFDGFATTFPSSDLARAAQLRAAQMRSAAMIPATPAIDPGRVAEPASLRPAKTKVNPKDGLTYVSIPPGSFTMGCSPGDVACFPDEEPMRQVTIAAGFWIGQTEVTQEAWQRVTGKRPSHVRGQKLPVDNVSWKDAQKYSRQQVCDCRRKPSGNMRREQAAWERGTVVSTLSPGTPATAEAIPRKRG